jgi:excisionase family DNA binding protein
MSKTLPNKIHRAAYSLSEAAELFGKDRSWIYRMVKDGKIRVVTGFGAMLISASEIERICGNTNKNGGAAL